MYWGQASQPRLQKARGLILLDFYSVGVRYSAATSSSAACRSTETSLENKRFLGSGVAEEGDAEHHAQQHEAGGVGEGNVDIAEAQVQPLRDLELVDRINRGVLQSEVHSFPVPSVGASGSDKFPSARAFSSR